MSENKPTKPTIVRRFLDTSGLTTFWNNVISSIETAKTEIKDYIDEKITKLKHTYGDASGYDKFVSEVTQENGIVNVKYAPISFLRGYELKTPTIINNIVNLNPNTYYKITSFPASGELTIKLNDIGVSDDLTCEYVFEFTMNSNIQLIFPADMLWENDDIPEIEDGITYVVSIVNNKAVYGAFNKTN